MVMVLAPDKRAKQSSEAKQLTEERHRVASNGSASAPVAATPTAGPGAPVQDNGQALVEMRVQAETQP